MNEKRIKELEKSVDDFLNGNYTKSENKIECNTECEEVLYQGDGFIYSVCSNCGKDL